jgi:hypothetical protein
MKDKANSCRMATLSITVGLILAANLAVFTYGKYNQELSQSFTGDSSLCAPGSLS